MKDTLTKQIKIKIIIADDHPMFRRGIVTILKQVSGIQQVTQATCGEDVVAILANEHHDLVLMDIKMSPLDGIQTTEIILKKYPKIKVIALSMFDDADMVMEMIHKGASGYLLKNADRAEIILAINKVMDGDVYYSKEIETLIHEKMNTVLFQEPVYSEDQLNHPLIREIIFLLCQELNNEEIAKLLSKSRRTIEAYRNKIIKSTRSNNIIGVLRYAMKRGILDDVKLKMKFMDKVKHR